MRKLMWIAVAMAAVVAGAWLAYPPFREWDAVVWTRTKMTDGLRTVGIDVPKTEPTKSAGKADAPAPGAKKGGRGGGAPVPVSSAVVEATEMPLVLGAPGTVEPYATAGVKPRVDGQISEIAFKEGQLVEAGQVMFRLDDRLMMAQIKQAEANIARDKASLKDAQAILARRETLVAKKIVTEASTDTQRSLVESLKASIVAGEAQLEAWRTQLDYLTLRAPIPGRTGTIRTELGVNVRAADATTLVTINQTRPITVSFAVPQTELAALRRALANGSQAVVRATGETAIQTKGRIVFIDNQVDRTTGTVLAKLEVANESEVLWPGQSVDVELTVEQRPGYVAVPATGVLPSQQGMLAWVVGPDGTVKPRTVELEQVRGAIAYVRGGLKAGERVVTDGQLRLAPGMRVVLREPGQEGAPLQRGGDPAAKGERKGGPEAKQKSKDGQSERPARPAGNGRS